MIRYFIVEFLFPLLLIFLVRAVLRNIFATFQATRTPQRPAKQSPPVQAGGELKRDPVCGTYVSTAVSVTRMVNGEVVHFCSKECREKYRAA